MGMEEEKRVGTCHMGFNDEQVDSFQGLKKEIGGSGNADAYG